MNRAESMMKVLKQLSNVSPDIEAAAIVDNDGLMIASSMSPDVEEDSVAAMTAAFLSLGERVGVELKRGEFELVMLRGSTGYAILARTGKEAVLTVMAKSQAKLGLIFLDVNRAAREITRLLAD